MKNFERRQKLEKLILNTAITLCLMFMTITVCSWFMEENHVDVIGFIAALVYSGLALISLNSREKRWNTIKSTFTRLEPSEEIKTLIEDIARVEFYKDDTDNGVIMVNLNEDYEVTKISMSTYEINKFF